MLSPAENPEGALERAIADAHAFAQDGRPCFGLTVLYQALAFAKGEASAGNAWAAETLPMVEAEIRSYRVKYRLGEL